MRAERDKGKSFRDNRNIIGLEGYVVTRVAAANPLMTPTIPYG